MKEYIETLREALKDKAFRRNFVTSMLRDGTFDDSWTYRGRGNRNPDASERHVISGPVDMIRPELVYAKVYEPLGSPSTTTYWRHCGKHLASSKGGKVERYYHAPTQKYIDAMAEFILEIMEEWINQIDAIALAGGVDLKPRQNVEYTEEV